MTVKSSISFTDRHHKFLKQKVEEGVSPSVSSLVASGVERLIQEEAQQQAMLEGLTKIIEARMQTPEDEWIVVEENDSIFDEARARLHSSK